MGTQKAIPFFALSLSMLLALDLQAEYPAHSGTQTQQQNQQQNRQQDPQKEEPDQKPAYAASIQPLDPFTGRISRNRVRLRIQPSLDASILKELMKDDYLVINGIADDFYAVKPPHNMKGYIYRTYVLDGQIEGNNVNVRLEPDIGAPVVTQMHTGDAVRGCISPLNNKWFEIDLPSNVSFFVAKEFVTRMGDASLFAEIEKRKGQLDSQMVQIDAAMIDELHKPFKTIQLAPLAAQLHHLIEQNEDMPQYVEKAEAMLHKMQEAYLQKSMAALQADFPPSYPNVAVDTVVAIDESAQKEDSSPPAPSSADSRGMSFTEAEGQRIQAAIDEGRAKSENDFYAQESKRSSRLKGIVKPFLRNVKNAPGDFMLVNPKTNVPSAFLFSNKVNLLELANKEVTVICVERPNNDYAFPAYFVISIEK